MVIQGDVTVWFKKDTAMVKKGDTRHFVPVNYIFWYFEKKRNYSMPVKIKGEFTVNL